MVQWRPEAIDVLLQQRLHLSRVGYAERRSKQLERLKCRLFGGIAGVIVPVMPVIAHAAVFLSNVAQRELAAVDARPAEHRLYRTSIVFLASGVLSVHSDGAVCVDAPHHSRWVCL
jgi:hypothetical protein